MSTITLKNANSTKSTINFHVNIDNRGSTGYESNVTLNKNDDDEWVASMSFETSAQDTPEDAIDRLGLYLREMAKAMKGKNVKHLNVDNMFKPTHKR